MDYHANHMNGYPKSLEISAETPCFSVRPQTPHNGAFTMTAEYTGRPQCPIRSQLQTHKPLKQNTLTQPAPEQVWPSLLAPIPTQAWRPQILVEQDATATSYPMPGLTPDHDEEHASVGAQYPGLFPIPNSTAEEGPMQVDPQSWSALVKDPFAYGQHPADADANATLSPNQTWLTLDRPIPGHPDAFHPPIFSKESDLFSSPPSHGYY
ncbi:hypothetical protein D9758_013165 [Tetrapyrgos nigripes]|uniref:Uncharacterized protein n=1 Tax=Tetrapyrgos nigripes TaxID=182062 RepID=A0A8H5CE16_9AGAR|nr:hypothetical protein D9758_013165 [Tetrapyrgos nigripes]